MEFLSYVVSLSFFTYSIYGKFSLQGSQHKFNRELRNENGDTDDDGKEQ